MWLTRFDEAAETAQAALQLAREVGDREHEAMNLGLILPMCAVRNGQFEEAKAYLREGIAVSERINFLRTGVVGKWFLAEIARWQGAYETALLYNNEALAMALPVEEMMPWLAVLILGSHGSTYLHISPQFKEEISNFHHHALKLLESPAGTMTAGTTWAELGFCAMTLGDNELAGEVFDKGLNHPTMFMRLERPRLLAGLALLALNNGDSDQAMQLAEEAVDYTTERKMRHMMPIVKHTLGEVLAARGANAQALAAFHDAEKGALALGMLPDAWKAQLAAAEILAKEGDVAAAQAKGDQARAVVQEIAAGFTDETLKSAYLETTLKRFKAV